MKFLITTEPEDTHAILVKIGLESMGHQVRCLFTADHPTRLKNSIIIDNDTYQWRSTDNYDSIEDNSFDVVWWRRARKPHVPKDATHPDDYKFVARENAFFFESLANTMAPSARWVNNKEAAFRANSKILQLKLAVECGMTIPRTLCSNDPQDIRSFLSQHRVSGVIYKPLSCGFWFEGQDLRITYTSKPSFLELPSDESLQLTPGIFQKEIKKKYELRVNYFDGYIVAAKLNSQNHDEGKIDWRAIGDEMVVEPYILPSNLENQIRAFMKKIGLVFGALDFIVSEDNEYIFLEVNEQGQFLWLEDRNPEFKMLDIFINCLLNTAPSFHWDRRNTIHSIEKYQNQIDGILAQNMRRHIALNNSKSYNA